MQRRKFLTYSLLFAIAGCTSFTSQPSDRSPDPSAIPKPEKLRFTVSDIQGLDALKKDYDALRLVLEQVLETTVEFFPVESYVAAASALQLNQVDLVLTGPSEYVVIRARTNASPVIAIQRQKYYPVITAPAQSGIQSLTGLKGKKIALKEIGSTSGYLGPIKLLIDAGLDPKSDVKIELLGRKGLVALKAGKVDAWGGSAVDYDNFLTSEGLTPKQLPVLQRGSDLPPDLFVLNSKLDAAYVTAVQQQLLQNKDAVLKAIEPADGAKYTGATMRSVQDSDYDMIRQVYKTMGQDSFLKG